MVFEKISEIIAEKLEIDKNLITRDSSLIDMKIDSLCMVEIMLSIEEEFNITIDDTDNLDSVADIVAYVENKIK